MQRFPMGYQQIKSNCTQKNYTPRTWKDYTPGMEGRMFQHVLTNKYNILQQQDNLQKSCDQHDRGYKLQTTASIVQNGKKLKSFPQRSRTRPGYPLSPFLFKIVWRSSTRAVRQEK